MDILVVEIIVHVIMFVLLVSLALVCANSFESSCDMGTLFQLTDLSLQYYPPPDGKDFTMVRALGVFLQNTYVSQVEVSWSPDDKNWYSYPSPINYTYVPEQLVQFAPWYKLKELPSKGQYFNAQLLIQGSISTTQSSETLSCISFTIPMDPSIPL